MAGDSPVRRIATEEAFAIPEQFDRYRELAHSTWSSADVVFWGRILNGPPNRLVDALLDVDEVRLADMDANGVDVQLLLLTSPGVQVFDADTATSLATLANDRLAEAIARHPDRFAGLATFAPQDPARAATEMERAITQLRLNGFVVNSHTEGEYLDQERFWPILEAAEALDAPIYIHPRPLPPSAIGPYLEHELWAGIWGYAAETGLHGMRLIASGVLDRFPRLKIVLGHMGEGLPYFVYRMDHMSRLLRQMGAHKPYELDPSEYLRRNFLITTSGMNHHPPLTLCVDVLGADHVMWAIDYPYQQTPECVEFMDSAPLSDSDRARIYAHNAERAFGIAAPAAAVS
jgi:predicted TIM-barrel fold metal-dependent hydrolase